MKMLLNIKGLRTHFFTEAGVVKAVDNVDLNIEKNEIFGLVGESGSGKTVTAYSVLRIVPRPGKILSGKIMFKGEDLLAKSEEEMRRVRGKEIAMIFQDPTSSLDPLYTAGDQISEVIRTHQEVLKREALEKAIKLLESIGLPEPETIIDLYPHELSGGMKQRIAIARAICSEPALLFADEPTTNLDVTIQAQVLDLLKGLTDRAEMSMVLITHDMGIIAEMTQRVTVMYSGMVAETTDTETLFEKPRHPYTEALLSAIPRFDQMKTLKVIPGNIPNLINPPLGCRFHPRCPHAAKICSQKIPVLEEVDEGHLVACHRWRELYLGG